MADMKEYQGKKVLAVKVDTEEVTVELEGGIVLVIKSTYDWADDFDGLKLDICKRELTLLQTIHP